MNLKVKVKLSEGAVMPFYSKEGDNGLDLTAISKETVNEKDHGYIEYETGVAISVPEGYVGLVYPRSSISKTGMILANNVAVIDNNYTGTIKLRFKWIPDTKMYEPGDKIGQLIFTTCPKIEFEQVDELFETVRGEQAFGSSDEVKIKEI